MPLFCQILKPLKSVYSYEYLLKEFIYYICYKLSIRVGNMMNALVVPILQGSFILSYFSKNQLFGLNPTYLILSFSLMKLFGQFSLHIPYDEMFLFDVHPY